MTDTTLTCRLSVTDKTKFSSSFKELQEGTGDFVLPAGYGEADRNASPKAASGAPATLTVFKETVHKGKSTGKGKKPEPAKPVRKAQHQDTEQPPESPGKQSADGKGEDESLGLQTGSGVFSGLFSVFSAPSNPSNRRRDLLIPPN